MRSKNRYSISIYRKEGIKNTVVTKSRETRGRESKDGPGHRSEFCTPLVGKRQRTSRKGLTSHTPFLHRHFHSTVLSFPPLPVPRGLSIQESYLIDLLY